MIKKYISQNLPPRLRHMRRNLTDNVRISYSQCGEDLVVKHVLWVVGISRVHCRHVGAHHPQYKASTCLFYVRRNRNVLAEPNPVFFQDIVMQPPGDTSLNCSVGAALGSAEFHVMSTSTLNTFSREKAQSYQSYGTHHIVKTLNMELKTINDIFEHSFTSCPHFVSLDVERLDYVILDSFNFERFRPQVFCLETLFFTEDKSERKLTEIIDLMHSHGYMTYADTYINTIFVDKAAWDKRA